MVRPTPKRPKNGRITGEFLYSFVGSHAGYECEKCGAKDVRLYRKMRHTDLRCRWCVASDIAEAGMGNTRAVTQENNNDYKILGSYLAAIPTEDGVHCLTEGDIRQLDAAALIWWLRFPYKTDKPPKASGSPAD